MSERYASPTADHDFEGMSLRDYFAGQAMAAYIGCMADKEFADEAMNDGLKAGLSGPEYFAELSYTAADALLKQAKKEESK